MKRLMIVTIGLMLPTAVFSMFGMNLKLPIDESDGAFGFWVILVVAILSGTSVFAMVRWRKF